jgi:hypothetical protein
MTILVSYISTPGARSAFHPGFFYPVLKQKIAVKP